MAEYIEKAELIKKLCFETAEWYYSPTIKTIKDFPAADVQPIRHGWWIDHEPFERKNCNVCIECSVCNTWFGHDCIPKTKFCPNCGADMRGEKNA